MAEHKHAKKCAACKGTGKIAQRMRDPATGQVTIHRVTCHACQGTGTT